MISAMLIFGSIGIFVRKIALSSIEIAFLRAIIASLFLGGIGFFLKQNKSTAFIKQNRTLLLLSGAAMGLNWIFLFQAYQYTTISNATLSYYFAPVFVIFLSPIVLKEKLTKKKMVCLVMAMIGLFLVINAESNDINSSYQHVKGILYGISGAALYASIILMNKYIKNLSGFETTLIQLIVSALVLLPVLLYQNSLKIAHISSTAWVLILILGIIHTGCAYLLYFSSIKNLKGQSIAILSYIDPISAVVMASIFLEENITFFQIIGGILILGSTFFSESKKFFSTEKLFRNPKACNK